MTACDSAAFGVKIEKAKSSSGMTCSRAWERRSRQFVGRRPVIRITLNSRPNSGNRADIKGKVMSLNRTTSLSK